MRTLERSNFPSFSRDWNLIIDPVEFPAKKQRLVMNYTEIAVQRGNTRSKWESALRVNETKVAEVFGRAIFEKAISQFQIACQNPYREMPLKAHSFTRSYSMDITRPSGATDNLSIRINGSPPLQNG